MKVILLNGNHNNLTLATIRFDKWGTPTRQDVIECSNWAEGIDQAGEGLLLLVKSGTVFNDWFAFTST